MKAALAALAFTVAAPAAAAPETQLELLVQRKLDALGFVRVDAGSLTTRQLGALHLNIRERDTFPGIPALDARPRVRRILELDGFDTWDRR